jgi:6-phosphofructokinase 2
MPVTVTLTLNPCIDKSTTIPALVAEKKLSCSEPVLEPGGGGINVARAIGKLGGDAVAVYPAGGYTGVFFNELLQKEKVSIQPVPVQSSLRENIIVLDQSTNQQYRFGMPGAALLEKEWQQCLDTIQNTNNMSFLVASGSLPAGVPADIFARLGAIAKEKKARLIVDTSGEALKKAAQEKVYLLKPNLGELSMLANRTALNMESVEDVAREIIDRGWCEVMVVSMGAAGAIMVTAGKTYRAIPPPVVRKSTVGAGDSMVAGIIWSLSQNDNLQQALHYGVACGTAATMNPGTSLFNLPDVEKLYSILNQNAGTGYGKK